MQGGGSEGRKWGGVILGATGETNHNWLDAKSTPPFKQLPCQDKGQILSRKPWLNTGVTFHYESTKLHGVETTKIRNVKKLLCQSLCVLSHCHRDMTHSTNLHNTHQKSQAMGIQRNIPDHCSSIIKLWRQLLKRFLKNGQNVELLIKYILKVYVQTTNLERYK